MNEKRAKRFVAPRPEVPQGFPNDPRPDGVYIERVAVGGDIPCAVTVREGSIISRVPADQKAGPWWLNS